jgi:glyoxylase-like metal-dependent hydrolase (beta-lactamase superfamily II)
MSYKISRRNLLKGVGASALGLGLGARLKSSALAQTQPSNAVVPAYYQFAKGDLNFAIIKDASVTIPPAIFGVNVEEADVLAALEAANVPLNEDGTINNLFDIMVIQGNDRVILMDTGLPVPNAALLPAMEQIGLTPEDVTDVVVTHFHGDHVGKISIDGAITFPNAQHYFPQVEMDFIMGADNDGATNALNKLQPVMDNDMLMLYADEDEIIPGIQAIAAMGHSPGHHAMLIDTGAGQFLNMVDSTVNAFIGLPNPNFHIQFDADGPMAAETRINLLNRAADEQLMVFGYHFPFPGVGFIARDGEGFRFVPNAF